MSFERLPFDLSCYLFSKLDVEHLSGRWIVCLRRVSKSVLKICDAPYLVRSWCSRNVEFLIWCWQTLKVEIRLVGTYDWKVISGLMQNIFYNYGGDSTTTITFGALKAIMAAIERIITMRLKGYVRNVVNYASILLYDKTSSLSQNYFFMLEDDEEWESEADVSFCLEDVVDASADSLEFEPSDDNIRESEYDFELRAERFAKTVPSSWNELHARFSMMVHFDQKKRDEDLRSYTVFRNQTTKLMKENPQMLKERCSVTGMTPLLVLWRRIEGGEYYDETESFLEEVTRSALSFGADINAKDKLGRNVFDFLCLNLQPAVFLKTEQLKHLEDIRERNPTNDKRSWTIFQRHANFLLKNNIDRESVDRWTGVFPELFLVFPNLNLAPQSVRPALPLGMLGFDDKEPMRVAFESMIKGEQRKYYEEARVVYHGEENDLGKIAFETFHLFYASTMYRREHVGGSSIHFEDVLSVMHLSLMK